VCVENGGFFNQDLGALDGSYRVSHETWQLVNSFECRLPYTVLDIKGCLLFISLKKSFAQIYFALKLILLLHDSYIIFFIIVFGIKQQQSMEEDILNYLPTVIFRGTPCRCP